MSSLKDKTIVKEALKEIINEDPQFFKQLLVNLLKDDTITKEELESSVKKNFKRFDATFKALA